MKFLWNFCNCLNHAKPCSRSWASGRALVLVGFWSSACSNCFLPEDWTKSLPFFKRGEHHSDLSRSFDSIYTKCTVDSGCRHNGTTQKWLSAKTLSHFSLEFKNVFDGLYKYSCWIVVVNHLILIFFPLVTLVEWSKLKIKACIWRSCTIIWPAERWNGSPLHLWKMSAPLI